MFEKELIISASSPVDNKKISTIVKKINTLKEKSKIIIKSKKINLLSNWHLNNSTGNIQHTSKRFFQLKGVRYRSIRNKKTISSPMIFQNEIGILGILCQKRNGILHFLLQAKFEPGNINKFQLSPTIQATKSNIDRAHGGKKQEFIDFFSNLKKENTIVNILQSEQGDKFYKKRNRNIILYTKKKLKINGNYFFWLTISEIKEIMQFNNIVNMDTRSVISCIDYGSSNYQVKEYFKSILSNTRSFNSMRKILDQLREERKKFLFNFEITNLQAVKSYDSKDSKNSRINNFFIRGLSIKSNLREINSWDQPVIQTIKKEVYVLLIMKFQNKMHMMLNYLHEPGIYNNCELGASINFIENQNSIEEKKLDKIIMNKNNKVIHSSYQSEEGGRFNKVSNKYMIILLHNSKYILPNYKKSIWVSFDQFINLISMSCVVNVQLRSLFSLIKLH